MAEKNTSFLHYISSIISNFFNPLVSLFIYFVFIGLNNYSINQAISHFLPILIFTALPIIIWIYWNVKTGRYTNMDVSDRIQRKSLYLFIAVCITIYSIYHYFINGHLDFVMLFIMILLFALQWSNFYIKSSMHTAFNVFVAGLFFAINTKLGLSWLVVAIVVGITRIILKRHTIKEVFMGAGIAFLVSFLYLYCNIQFQQQ